jgi:Glycerol uptake facilitator and related permeases (Major Intrinsic Protein Family)
MSFKEMLCYWAAQFIGGIIAGALLLVIFKAIGGEATGVFASNGYGVMFQKACGGPETGYQAISMGGAFLVEALLTFVFLMVILGVTDSSHANGKFGGLAIGLTLVLIHLISIPLTNTFCQPRPFAWRGFLL